ncbi:MAG: polysaccharide biosynthesis/export family protein [Fimbriimonas sp.]
MLKRIAILLALALAALSFTQSSTPSDRDYRLRPEDFLRIQVFGQEILVDMPVGPDGKVTPPYAGPVLAEGKTTTELERDIAAKLKERLRLRDPIVSVSILRYRPISASVGGEVTRPGTYEVRAGDRLLTLLTQGGGAALDRADLRRATLRRRNSGEVIPIDLYALLILGDTTQNYEVRDGDVLTIPQERRNRISVQGAVPNPGQFLYREPMTLSDAISLAGGEVRYRSRLSRVLIIRERTGQPGQYTRILADYVRFVKKGDQAQNVVLEPGDFVYVPETNTPDFNQISALANTAFILQTFGNSFFGIRFIR